jgi:HAD superfamily hydrolase (TIGR01509 family)
MSAYDLIIFDCDGVLVDSEPITNAVFAELLNELGLKVTLQEMYARFMGRSMDACLSDVTRLLGRPIPADFLERYNSRTLKALQEKLLPVNGIKKLIVSLRTPYCVASSGDHTKMKTTLGITGLWDLFEGRLVSATEVSRGKPFPDVYLLAAERHRATPSRCAVVEDSPVGVTAAVAAGMTVFGFAQNRRSTSSLIAAGAQETFDDMSNLLELLDGPPP